MQAELPPHRCATHDGLANLPDWFRDLETTVGIAALECRISHTISESLRLFYRFSATARWLLAPGHLVIPVIIATKNMTSPRFIRQAIAEDYDILADVMFDAVRNGPDVYTEEQRHAWVPLRRTGAAWIERLDSQTIFVAADTDQVFGFMSLAANGYIDLAFIRPSAQGTGLFRRLYHTVEDLAKQTGQFRLWVHASIQAQPAFAAVGFSVTQREAVTIGEESLKRFQMEKYLDRPEVSK